MTRPHPLILRVTKVWLENILSSRAMDPVKALTRAGLFSGLVNKFDGGVEILDDMDDHWTAKHHKTERTLLIEDLQDLAAEKSVRVTILGYVAVPLRFGKASS